MAGGAGGQYIAILPALDLVVAHKAIRESAGDVSVGRFLSILDLIVTAKTGRTEPVEVHVAESVLRDYVGSYELAPGAVMIITLENGGLFAQLSGQRRVQVFAESESRFFYRGIDATISFTRNPSGAVIGLLLQQSAGRMTPGRRLP